MHISLSVWIYSDHALKAQCSFSRTIDPLSVPWAVVADVLIVASKRGPAFFSLCDQNVT